MTTDISYRQDFYGILGVDERRGDAVLSSTDLRIAYKRALLAHHPDKHADSHGVFTVDQISLAYKVLSDPKLRHEYDNALQHADGAEQWPSKFRIFHTGLDTFDLDDLSFNEDSQTWTKSCRCGEGGGFVVTEHALETTVADGEIITGCEGCSLWIRVLFSVEQ